jgi:quercetin dioxygenase-like cupin family protein
MGAQGEWVSGNVFIRPNPLEKKGDSVDGHTHPFDHTTIVFKGAVHVVATGPNGELLEQDFVAPAHFLVRANWCHQITALEDDTVFWCVYSHRTPQGDIVQEYSGWREATT